MELEFRNIHIDMLALPIEIMRNTLTPSEITLAQEFTDNLCVTRGIVLAARDKPLSRYRVTLGYDVIKAAQRAGIHNIPCLIAKSFPAPFIELLASQKAEFDDLPQKREDVIQTAIQVFNQLNTLKLSFRKAEKLEKIGKKSTLYDQKRLADNLVPQVQELVKSGKLSKSAARSISYLPKPEQFAFALQTIDNNWTVREINLARAKKADSPVDKQVRQATKALGIELAESIGCSVKFIPKTRKSGEMQIEFFGFDMLSDLIKKLSEANCEFQYSLKGRHATPGKSNESSSLCISYMCLEVVDELKRALMTTPH